MIPPINAAAIPFFSLYTQFVHVSCIVREAENLLCTIVVLVVDDPAHLMGACVATIFTVLECDTMVNSIGAW